MKYRTSNIYPQTFFLENDSHVTLWTAGQTTKDSYIFKITIYIFILRRHRFWVIGIQSERVRTYLSSVVVTFFVKLSVGRRTHTRSWQVCLSDQQVSLLAWESSGPLPFVCAITGSLPSVQIYKPYVVFLSPMQKYEHPLHLTHFLFMAGYQNTYFRFYSGNLFTLSANGNICHSIYRQ